MSKTATSLFPLLIALAGCGHEGPAKPAQKKPAQMSRATAVKTVSISGFDPEGEPEIREMSDGTLMVLFNFMPPSYAEDEEAKYADFEKQLERAAGVPVNRDDRELFLIRNPQNDTSEKLKAFLEGYRKDNE